jgi:hypothetical protein
VTTTTVFVVALVILVVVVGLSLAVGRLSVRNRCQAHGHGQPVGGSRYTIWILILLFLVNGWTQLTKRP